MCMWAPIYQQIKTNHRIHIFSKANQNSGASSYYSADANGTASMDIIMLLYLADFVGEMHKICGG